MKVYFGADHGGFHLKEKLKPFVASLGYDVEDMGAYALDMNDDYPVFVMAAARKVAEDPENRRGIVIGGSGQGEGFAANRIKHVRAVVYYGEPERKQTDADGKQLDMITSTREHNDSNVLSLAGRFLTEDEAKDAVKRWLAAPHDKASRHDRRHRMIDELA
jgi:ribose 5-phosphate isomerase B